MIDELQIKRLISDNNADFAEHLKKNKTIRLTPLSNTDTFTVNSKLREKHYRLKLIDSLLRSIYSILQDEISFNIIDHDLKLATSYIKALKDINEKL